MFNGNARRMANHGIGGVQMRPGEINRGLSDGPVKFLKLQSQPACGVRISLTGRFMQ
jgi:hypothetical protein